MTPTTVRLTMMLDAIKEDMIPIRRAFMQNRPSCGLWGAK
jgi:hypothetical protein